MGHLYNGAYVRTCQRSGCDTRVYLKVGINYKIILLINPTKHGGHFRHIIYPNLHRNLLNHRSQDL